MVDIPRRFMSMWPRLNFLVASTNLQPELDELRNMSDNASQVVQLLEEFKQLMSSGDQTMRDAVAGAPAVDEHRPPKRPWEDMEQDNQGTPSDADVSGLAFFGRHTVTISQIRYDETSQSTAEQDMEIIRSKRATSSTGTTPGQTKSKYRKRSVCRNYSCPSMKYRLITLDHVAGNATRQMPFMQHPRNPGVEAWAGRGEDLVQRLWPP